MKVKQLKDKENGLEPPITTKAVNAKVEAKSLIYY